VYVPDALSGWSSLLVLNLQLILEAMLHNSPLISSCTQALRHAVHSYALSQFAVLLPVHLPASAFLRRRCLLSPTQVRIDHKNGTLHFGADQLEGDRLRDHIAVMAQRFARALTMIDPNVEPAREQRRIAVSFSAHSLV
jgi:hypothetical protein